jgi:hypothetical protein
MAGLVPAIHGFRKKVVDPRDKPGDDVALGSYSNVPLRIASATLK